MYVIENIMVPPRCGVHRRQMHGYGNDGRGGDRGSYSIINILLTNSRSHLTLLPVYLFTIIIFQLNIFIIYLRE